jgi:hypothetical protein
MADPPHARLCAAKIPCHALPRHAARCPPCHALQRSAAQRCAALRFACAQPPHLEFPGPQQRTRGRLQQLARWRSHVWGRAAALDHKQPQQEAVVGQR